MTLLSVNDEAVFGHEQATAIIRGTEVGELRLMVQRPRPAMMPPGLHGMSRTQSVHAPHGVERTAGRKGGGGMGRAIPEGGGAHTHTGRDHIFGHR